MTTMTTYKVWELHDGKWCCFIECDTLAEAEMYAAAARSYGHKTRIAPHS